MTKKLSASLEDYLEAIDNIISKNKVARVKEISKFLKVKTSSVNSAVNKLADKGFVIHEKYGFIELTTKGKATAEKVQQRHDTLTFFLENILQLDTDTADKDACKIEHVLSNKTFDRFIDFIKFIDTCPKNNKPHWLEKFKHYCQTGERLV